MTKKIFINIKILIEKSVHDEDDFDFDSPTNESGSMFDPTKKVKYEDLQPYLTGFAREFKFRLT